MLILTEAGWTPFRDWSNPPTPPELVRLHNQYRLAMADHVARHEEMRRTAKTNMPPCVTAVPTAIS